MALLTEKDKFKREEEERQQAWDLLRSVPEYIKAYKQTVRLRAKKPKSDSKKIKAIEEKWGFGTLENPEEERPSFEFLNFFSDYNTEVSRNNSVVDFKGLENFSRKRGVIYDPNDDPCEKQTPPSEVTVKIDVEAPIGVILKEIKSGLEHIKSLFDIPNKNTSSHDHLVFLVDTLQRAGLSKIKIVNRLTPKHIISLPYDEGQRESVRKRIIRRIKKT
jgi:hypothetical protein